MSSRTTRAASSGRPLESRVTSSSMRPSRPPEALNSSIAICAALREDSPSCATRPDRMVGWPILIGAFAWPRTSVGNPIVAIAPLAVAPLIKARRDVVRDAGLVMNPPDRLL